MRSLLALAFLGLLSAPAVLASDLVGPASCRTCHVEAYKIWSGSAHARALVSLTAEQRRTPLCLQCHSRDEARAGQADVSGVSCETCHGGGRWYQPAAVMRDKELSRAFGLADATPQSCMVCHGGETPSLQKFDVKEAMGRIDHWTVDRAARKKHLSTRSPGADDASPHVGAQGARPQPSRTQLAVWLGGNK